MREILFRGKRQQQNGAWVEGHYLYADRPIIYAPEVHRRFEVIPETVGQYVGLEDKNGRRIFEGDIVFVTDDEGRSGMIDTGVGTIIFLDGIWYIDGNVQNSLYDINKCFYIEVIGNIHDNPDMLKE